MFTTVTLGLLRERMREQRKRRPGMSVSNIVEKSEKLTQESNISVGTDRNQY